jgi:SAM-dependent methyltransferase
MPTPPTAPISASSPPTGASASAARKALFWDRIAPKYAADPIADLAGYEATVRRVQALLSSDQEVLEIGCGTGSTALRLAPFTRSLLATDISPGMVAIAQGKLAAQPTPQLRFALADADAPGFGQGTFDAVLAFNLLHMVLDLDQALQGVVQALRPGGLLISKTPCIAEMNLLIPWFALPIMRAIGKAPHVLRFNAQELQSVMVRQGMEIVSVERHGTRRRGRDIRPFIVARKPF